jgi:hypothetical protein
VQNCQDLTIKSALSNAYFDHAINSNRITRKLGLDEKLVHVFTTQFFSRLEDEGVDAITSWTAKKGVDIFEKKFIFIPVNKDTHWSLLVIVNPGKIQNRIDIDTLENIHDENEDVEFPFILFMDSLRLHKKKKLKLLIYKWLNSEAQRLGKFQDFVNKPLFCNVYMPVIDPKGKTIFATMRVLCYCPSVETISLSHMQFHFRIIAVIVGYLYAGMPMG